MERSIKNFLKNSDQYKSIVNSTQFLSRKQFYDGTPYENVLVISKQQSEGGGGFGDNVVGGGDGTANTNTKFFEYDSNSWGQIFDLGQIGLQSKKIQFEQYSSFPASNVVVLVGTAIAPIVSKTFIKTTYPSLPTVTIETDFFKNNGVSYRFNTDSTHSVYINNVINTGDAPNLNVTGPTFWLFDGDYIAFSRITSSTIVLSSQRGILGVNFTNTALYCYCIIYKLTEAVHNTIKFTYNDNSSRNFVTPFNYLDSLLVDRRMYQLFGTHPQNYTTICTIPYKIGNGKEWYIKFEDINDLDNQKIYIGVCSTTLYKDFINKADFDTFTSVNESINSFGDFQIVESAFTESKYIRFNCLSSSCTVSCGSTTHTFLSSTNKFVYIGVKYDTPINFKCLLYVTSDEFVVPDKIYKFIIPRHYRGIHTSVAKLPSIFKADLTLLDVLSTDRIELRLNPTSYVTFTESTGATLGGIGIYLNTAINNYNALFTRIDTYLPQNANSFYMPLSNQTTTITMYYIDNWIYFKSNGNEFAMKFIFSGGEVHFGLSIMQNSTLQISDGEMMQRVALTNYSTSVVAPTNHNYFSLDGYLLYTGATITPSTNVGSFYTLYDQNAWGDTLFNPLFKNAFVYELATTFSTNTGRAYFIGLVESSTTLTSNFYGSISNLEAALISENAWGILITGPSSGANNAIFKNGVKTPNAGFIQFTKSGFAFYKDKLYLVTFHDQTREITQIYNFGSGMDRSKTYTLIWGAFNPNSFNFQHTVYTGRLGGYLGD